MTELNPLRDAVIEALREAVRAYSAINYEARADALLAKLAAMQEPVAWMICTGHGNRVALHVPKCEIPEAWKPLVRPFSVKP